MRYVGSNGSDFFLGTGLLPDATSENETLSGGQDDDQMYIGDVDAVADGGSGTTW